ncbi:MAG TPA: hypothetical protein VGK74_02655 [Symbiobacteriaceae bacterium]|jgi:hypothetical protein
MSHQCPACHPERFGLPAEKQGPNHVAGRFDSWNIGFNVALNGVQMRRVTEAMAGEEGWVVVQSDHGDVNQRPHVCSCGQGVCQELKRGRVELVTNGQRVPIPYEPAFIGVDLAYPGAERGDCGTDGPGNGRRDEQGKEADAAMNALTVKVEARLRNEKPVLAGMKVLAFFMRLTALKAKTAARIGNALLRHLHAEVRIGNSEWFAIAHGTCMEATTGMNGSIQIGG